jgi:hypothetical protein
MARGRLSDLGARARVRPAAGVLIPDQPLDFGMGNGAAAMNPRALWMRHETTQAIPHGVRGAGFARTRSRTPT